MVLVFLKNFLTGSSPKSRYHGTPPLLPTIQDFSTDFTTTSTASLAPTGKDYGTAGSCEPQSSAPCRHPSCPRRQSSRNAETSKLDDGEGQLSKPLFDPRVLSDLTIGLSDGLTVPFALTAGLSAFNDTKVVLYGGIAELIAGSISMGLGGWLAGRGEAEFYQNTLHATESLIDTSPSSIPPLLHSIFAPYYLPDSALAPMVASLSRCDRGILTSFILRFHHRLPAPEENARTPVSSAVTIAAGYFFGGFVPLMPYFFVARSEVLTGLAWSVGVMVACLFAFGMGKTLLVAGQEGGGAVAVGKPWGKAIRGGVEMVLVGGVAAAAAMGIVRALGGLS